MMPQPPDEIRYPSPESGDSVPDFCRNLQYQVERAEGSSDDLRRDLSDLRERIEAELPPGEDRDYKLSVVETEIGHLFKFDRQYRQAIEAYDRARHLVPDESVAGILTAYMADITAHELGSHAEAIPHYEEAHAYFMRLRERLEDPSFMRETMSLEEFNEIGRVAFHLLGHGQASDNAAIREKGTELLILYEITPGSMLQPFDTSGCFGPEPLEGGLWEAGYPTAQLVGLLGGDPDPQLLKHLDRLITSAYEDPTLPREIALLYENHMLIQCFPLFKARGEEGKQDYVRRWNRIKETSRELGMSIPEATALTHTAFGHLAADRRDLAASEAKKALDQCKRVIDKGLPTEYVRTTDLLGLLSGTLPPEEFRRIHAEFNAHIRRRNIFIASLPGNPRYN